MSRHQDATKVLSISTAAALSAFCSYSYLSKKNKGGLGMILSDNNNKKVNNYYSNGFINNNLLFNNHTTECESIQSNHFQNIQHNLHQKAVEQHDILSSSTYKPISRRQLFLHHWHLIRDEALPLPRLLSPEDPIFNYYKMRIGLKQREKDEIKLRQLQSEIALLVEKHRENEKSINYNYNHGDKDRMNLMTRIMERISEIAYGKGITPQDREDFLARYGCTAYNTQILDTIIKYSANCGIIDIGAGNGQWSKAISDRHAKLLQANSIPASPLGNFIVAYDDMSQLPLNTQIYHKYTKPAQEFFFGNVQDMKGQEAVGLMKNRGRVLLLVYPPPGDMATQVVKQYSKFQGNDTVIYVGEGIGGANANQEFFNYFLNHENETDNDGNTYKWCIMDIHNIEDTLGGGKGFEMMFVLKRIKIS